MSYELCAHTADVAVEATAGTLGDVFAAVADGMAAAMCDSIPGGGSTHEIAVDAESREALLFDYLDDLIYERDVRSVLPADNEATIEGGRPVENGSSVERTESDNVRGSWRLQGQYRGVPLSAVTARDLKAVTYSEMDLSETEDGWYAYVVFDV